MRGRNEMCDQRLYFFLFLYVCKFGVVQNVRTLEGGGDIQKSVRMHTGERGLLKECTYAQVLLEC